MTVLTSAVFLLVATIAVYIEAQLIMPADHVHVGNYQAVAVNTIDERCMSSLCEAEGCESRVGRCRLIQGVTHCGPFLIQENYWNECGRPGSDYESCCKDMECSQKCITTYTSRYAPKCAGSRPLTCQDFVRVHKGGPGGCSSSATLPYWQRVREFWEKK